MPTTGFGFYELTFGSDIECFNDGVEYVYDAGTDNYLLLYPIGLIEDPSSSGSPPFVRIETNDLPVGVVVTINMYDPTGQTYYDTLGSKPINKGVTQHTWSGITSTPLFFVVVVFIPRGGKINIGSLKATGSDELIRISDIDQKIAKTVAEVHYRIKQGVTPEEKTELLIILGNILKSQKTCSSITSSIVQLITLLNNE